MFVGEVKWPILHEQNINIHCSVTVNDICSRLCGTGTLALTHPSQNLLCQSILVVILVPKQVTKNGQLWYKVRNVDCDVSICDITSRVNLRRTSLLLFIHIAHSCIYESPVAAHLSARAIPRPIYQSWSSTNAGRRMASWGRSESGDG